MVILVQPNTRHRTPDTDSGHPLKGGVLSCPFCPPDISGQCPVLSGLSGQLRLSAWWQRLKKALGTSSSAFVEASLYQLIAAARLPNSGICEIAVNASLAFIEGAKPRDEIECALVIQMACTHSAAMAVLNRLGGAAGDRTVAAMASAAARLLRAYATQVEALRRLRNGGSQTLRVEHVHVNEGGQALIGNVSSQP